MDSILDIARRAGLAVVEDAAQGIYSRFRDQPLGAIGDFGCLSFHETKNITCGEGGALLLRDDSFVTRAEVIREKGTDRSRFFRGEVDKYTWVDLGSSYLPGELTMAFLWAQLESGEPITRRRMHIWNRYHEGLAALEESGSLRRPVVPEYCEQNAHMYYILLKDTAVRNEFIQFMKKRGIGVVFHYVPLHSSEAGRRLGRAHGSLQVTNSVSERLVRLPLWPGVETYIDEILESVYQFFALGTRR